MASPRRSYPRRSWPQHNGGGWTGDAGVGFVKTLGVLELLAAVGLILPAVLDIAPVLVPVTAVCWVLLMVGAMITHGRRGEFALAVLNLIYLALAAFIAWGRSAPGLHRLTGRPACPRPRSAGPRCHPRQSEDEGEDIMVRNTDVVVPGGVMAAGRRGGK